MKRWKDMWLTFFLLIGGAYFVLIAIHYLAGVSSHGWMNVWQTGSVGLLMLFGGALDVWIRWRKR